MAIAVHRLERLRIAEDRQKAVPVDQQAEKEPVTGDQKQQDQPENDVIRDFQPLVHQARRDGDEHHIGEGPESQAQVLRDAGITPELFVKSENRKDRDRQQAGHQPHQERVALIEGQQGALQGGGHVVIEQIGQDERAQCDDQITADKEQLLQKMHEAKLADRGHASWGFRDLLRCFFCGFRPVLAHVVFPSHSCLSLL